MIVQLPKFKTYKIVISDMAKEFIAKKHLEQSLARFRNCDYGILCSNNWAENEEDLERGEGFILGVYEYIAPTDDVIEYYITTYFDKQVTKVTLVLEEEIWFYNNFIKPFKRYE